MINATRRQPAICIFCASKVARFSSSTTSSQHASAFVTPQYSEGALSSHKTFSFAEKSSQRRRDRRPRTLQPFRFRDKSVYDKEDRKVYGSDGAAHLDLGPLPDSQKRETPKVDPRKLLQKALDSLEAKHAQDNSFVALNLDPDDLKIKYADFKKRTLHDVTRDTEKETWITKRLKETCALRKRRKDLEKELYYAFYGELVLPRAYRESQGKLTHFADLRYPSEWYGPARRLKREIHVHVGPTNSGKTYQALQRLQLAKTGIYAGPLRLLAHEVYMRMNAAGRPCRLLTGDERRDIPVVDTPTVPTDEQPASLVSSTVEMVPKREEFEVAVIDEIQMIGSPDRGFAWTEAFMGVRAREVHLCGEERTVPIIKELAAMCNEEVVLHRYERLNPLKMMKKSLGGNLHNLEKGDCVVAFSVVMIHGLRKIIEKTLKKKVAIIYGGLPPETRAQQARLFNDPDNDYDILVASNAVGMGLNLNIKRMIFQSSTKSNGTNLELISVADVKQIAGRAGRFSTAHQDMTKSAPGADVTVSPDPPPKQSGLVTTLEPFDFNAIEKALTSNPEPITSAGILPPWISVERFAKFFPSGTPLSHIIIRLCEFVRMNQRFFICDLKSILSISDVVDRVEGLSNFAKWTFCAAPIEPRKPGEIEVAQECAEAVAESKSISILDMRSIQLETLEEDIIPNRLYLRSLERLHKALIVFMWLSFRFPRVFVQRHVAEHVKHLTEQRINEVLSLLSVDYDKLRGKRERAIKNMLASDEAIGESSRRPSTSDPGEISRDFKQIQEHEPGLGSGQYSELGESSEPIDAAAIGAQHTRESQDLPFSPVADDMEPYDTDESREAGLSRKEDTQATKLTSLPTEFSSNATSRNKNPPPSPGEPLRPLQSSISDPNDYHSSWKIRWCRT